MATPARFFRGFAIFIVLAGCSEPSSSSGVDGKKSDGGWMVGSDANIPPLDLAGPMQSDSRPVDNRPSDAVSGRTDTKMDAGVIPKLDAGNPASSGRPATSKGDGFYVVGTKIYDRKGQEAFFMGINHTHFWGDNTANLAAVPEIAKTRTNLVRAVFGGDSSSAFRKQVVEAYAAQRIPVMVEDHRGTCKNDPGLVAAATDAWIKSADWLKVHEPHTILNITNEWGPDGDPAGWANAYIAAVPRLRAAGLHHLIVIDAGGDCGQNPRSVLEKGAEILQADPEKNIAFSVHAYAFWRTPGATDVGKWNDRGQGSPWSFEVELKALQAAGLAIVMGEVGFDGSSEVGYDTKAALKIFASLRIGWIGWSWNQNNPSADLDFIKGGSNYKYNSPSDLSPAGTLFVLDPEVGIQPNAVATRAFE